MPDPAPPIISVLIPVFKGDKFLKETLQSLVDQSFPHWEALILLNGTRDLSQEIAGQFARQDSRFRLESLSGSINVADTLNYGVAKAHTDFIAILHQDDRCLPDRLARQVETFQKNPDIHILTGNAQEIDVNGTSLSDLNLPAEPVQFFWQLLFSNPCKPSTIAFRRSVFPSQTPVFSVESPAYTYEFLTRSFPTHSIHCLPGAPLIQYRIHPQQASRVNSKERTHSISQISRNRLISLNPELQNFSAEVHQLLQKHFHHPPEDHHPSFASIALWIQPVLKAAQSLLPPSAHPFFTTHIATPWVQWQKEVVQLLPKFRLSIYYTGDKHALEEMMQELNKLEYPHSHLHIHWKIPRWHSAKNISPVLQSTPSPFPVEQTSYDIHLTEGCRFSRFWLLDLASYLHAHPDINGGYGPVRYSRKPVGPAKHVYRFHRPTPLLHGNWIELPDAMRLLIRCRNNLSLQPWQRSLHNTLWAVFHSSRYLYRP